MSGSTAALAQFVAPHLRTMQLTRSVSVARRARARLLFLGRDGCLFVALAGPAARLSLGERSAAAATKSYSRSTPRAAC
jgi:hypothetical protein